MKRIRMALGVFSGMAILSVGLLGCPPDLGVSLLVSPETLDFGTDRDELLLKVSKTATGGAMEPLVATADEPWILPQNCLQVSDGCVSRGPGNAIRIPVRVNRDNLVFGLNTGTLRLTANTASPELITVVVDEIAQADFSSLQQQVSFGRAVEFRDLSQTATEAGPVERWIWDFGDGKISTLPNPFHKYDKPGLYDVSLTIRTTQGITRTALKEAYIRVADIDAEVEFVASKTNADVGEEIVFTDLSHVENTPILARKWAFGDGTVSTALTPRHRYDAAGMYTVSLTITTAAGDLTATKERYIVIRSAEGPQANFVYDLGVRGGPYVNEIIQFRDLSTPGSGAITAWHWDFGDEITSSDQNPTHVYAEKGDYDVSLKIETAYGTDTITKPISLTYRPPKADFEATPRNNFIGEPIRFVDLSEAGYEDITSWTWSFGDGTTVTYPDADDAPRNPSQTHVYNETGVYTVTLKVVGGDPDSRQDEIVKQDYIRIIEGPTPDFTWTPPLVRTNDEVTFNGSSSVPASEDILRYDWDFGDGATSTGMVRSHQYSAPGQYPVTLTLRTATASTSLTKELIVVQPPDFTFSPSDDIWVGETEVNFSVLNESGVTITRYSWDFGDGTNSNLPSPTHTYEQARTYTVRFTARYRHNQAGPDDPLLAITRERELVVNNFVAPAIDITSVPAWSVTEDEIVVGRVNASSSSMPITRLHLDFGDGATDEIPYEPPVPQIEDQPITHHYAAPGEYTLTATLEAGTLPPTTVTWEIIVLEKVALDAYISLDDDCFHYSDPVTAPITYTTALGAVQVGTSHSIYRMVSQCWNPDNAVHADYVEWEHTMVIYDPSYKSSDSAMLFIDGGSRNSEPIVEEVLSLISVLSGTPIVHIKNIPSQPIVFKDEVIAVGEEDNYSGEPFILRSRREDAAIAYSYDRYMQSWLDNDGNATPEWPLLFPMAKAAVKALDVAEELLGPIEDGFVVAGASKRGWTTWLAGAVDPRIRAIAPIVINVLNMPDHLQHHRNAYGYWSPAIYDYAQEGIFDQLLPHADGMIAPEAQALLEQVDPYEYALQGRYPIPKFMMNATGDEFFVPDTTEFYFPDLEGDKHLNYVPNVGHGMASLDENEMTETDNPIGMLLAWYLNVTQDIPLPQFSYSFEDDGSIRVLVDAANPPSSVLLWSATSQGARDFRDHIVGQAWTAAALEAQADGSYVGEVATPDVEGAYTAFFIQLRYDSAAQFPPTMPSQLRQGLEAEGYTLPDMTFSSGVRVLPEVYPEFSGYLANTERPDAVYFDETKLPVIVVYGTPYEMGYYYGQMLAQDISGFLPAMIATYQAETGHNDAFLDNAWASDAASFDPRLLEEIEGIADGLALVAPNRDADEWRLLLQRAHAAALREPVDDITTSTVLAYRGLMLDADSAHAVSINGPLARNLHQYQCAIVYIPDEGLPHTVLTHAGLTFGRTGINLGAISAVEVPDPERDVVSDNSHHTLSPLIRSILYDALSLRDAIALAEQTPPAYQTNLMLNDGRNELRGALLSLDPLGIEQAIFDMSGPDDVLASQRGGLADSAPTLTSDFYASIMERIVNNTFSVNDLLGLATEQPYAQENANLLNVLFDTAGFRMQLNLAVAQGDQDAYWDRFEILDMQQLLP